MTSNTFKRTFLPMHAKLYRLAFRLLGNANDAEDMVQETYIKLWKKRDVLHEIQNHESYAVTLLKNASLDVLRKQRFYSIEIEKVEVSEAYSTEEIIDAKDKIKLVGTVINNLPAQQKRVFELYHRDQLKMTEIENATGLSYNNIKMIISRARQTIKNALEKFER